MDCLFEIHFELFCLLSPVRSDFAAFSCYFTEITTLVCEEGVLGLLTFRGVVSAAQLFGGSLREDSGFARGAGLLARPTRRFLLIAPYRMALALWDRQPHPVALLALLALLPNLLRIFPRRLLKVLSR